MSARGQLKSLALHSALLAVLLTSSAAHAQSNAADFALEKFNATTSTTASAPTQLSLQQLRGKLVYLDFWASWCAPCKRSFPWMNQLQQRYGAQGFQVVAINVDAKREDALQFLQTTPAEFTVLFDPSGASAKAYTVKAMPSSYLIDANGKIVRQHLGFNADSAQTLENEIKALLEKK